MIIGLNIIIDINIIFEDVEKDVLIIYTEQGYSEIVSRTICLNLIIFLFAIVLHQMYPCHHHYGGSIGYFFKNLKYRTVG